MDNVWGTKASSIEVAVGEILARRVPVNGGILVEQAITRSGHALNASSGWVIELCQDEGFIYLTALGSTRHKKLKISLFRHVGGVNYLPDEHDLRSVASMEYACELYRRAQVDAEVDAAFNQIKVAS